MYVLYTLLRKWQTTPRITKIIGYKSNFTIVNDTCYEEKGNFGVQTVFNLEPLLRLKPEEFLVIHLGIFNFHLRSAYLQS